VTITSSDAETITLPFHTITQHAGKNGYDASATNTLSAYCYTGS